MDEAVDRCGRTDAQRESRQSGVGKSRCLSQRAQTVSDIVHQHIEVLPCCSDECVGENGKPKNSAAHRAALIAPALPERRAHLAFVFFSKSGGIETQENGVEL